MTANEIDGTDEFETPADEPTVSTRRRERVGDALGRTASRLHDRAADLDGKMTQAVDLAADAIDSTGKFVRDFDGGDMVADLKDMAKRHPGKTLLAAVAVGFIVGRALPHSDT